MRRSYDIAHQLFAIKDVLLAMLGVETSYHTLADKYVKGKFTVGEANLYLELTKDAYF